MDYLYWQILGSRNLGGTVAEGSDAKSENIVKSCIDVRIACDDYFLQNHMNLDACVAGTMIF